MKNRVIVIYNNVMPNVDCSGYNIQNIQNTKDLESFSLKTGTRIGIFPSLLDVNTSKWVPIYDNLEDSLVNLDTLIQDSKSVDQKIYENKFFGLCKDILTAIGDQRASDVSIPKLGFDEIITLIESYEITDFNASMKFSLKLLSLDAALKRYDILWWDSAKFHGNV